MVGVWYLVSLELAMPKQIEQCSLMLLLKPYIDRNWPNQNG